MNKKEVIYRSQNKKSNREETNITTCERKTLRTIHLDRIVSTEEPILKDYKDVDEEGRIYQVKHNEILRTCMTFKYS